jgi:hypothetical protein
MICRPFDCITHSQGYHPEKHGRKTKDTGTVSLSFQKNAKSKRIIIFGEEILLMSAVTAHSKGFIITMKNKRLLGWT